MLHLKQGCVISILVVIVAISLSNCGSSDPCEGVKCGNCEKCEVSVLDNTTFCKSIKDDRCDKVKQKHKGSVMLVDPTNHVVCHPKSCVPHPEAICEVDECNSCSGRWKSGQKYLEAKDCREVTTTVVPPTTEPVPEDKP